MTAVDGRRVAIIELNESELRRAEDWAVHSIHAKAVRRLAQRGDDPRAARADATGEARFLFHELGAQGELAVGKVLGVRAPLLVLGDQPDLPPNWSVKTQLSASKDMRQKYMRMVPGAFHRGWRHVLVERDVAIHGGFVFIVHGWIADDRAREVAVQRYAYSTNRFIHVRHLQPVEPLSGMDAERWAARAEKAIA